MTTQEPTTIAAQEVTAGFRPRPHEDVSGGELDGEAVLWDERSGAVHHLDPVGSIVWQLFDGTATVAELAGELAEAFRNADPAVVEADVIALCRSLGARGLLEGVRAEEPDEPAHTHTHAHTHDHDHDHGHGAAGQDRPDLPVVTASADERDPSSPAPKYIAVKGGG